MGQVQRRRTLLAAAAPTQQLRPYETRPILPATRDRAQRQGRNVAMPVRTFNNRAQRNRCRKRGMAGAANGRESDCGESVLVAASPLAESRCAAEGCIREVPSISTEENLFGWRWELESCHCGYVW